MTKQQENGTQNWYEDGATFAKEVQEALAAGKTFEDMQAMSPEHAAHVRDISRIPELKAWWDGYVSRWD